MNSQALFNTCIISKFDDKSSSWAVTILTIIVCSLGIAASAQITLFVPTISPVPFTLQTFAVMLIALTTGRKVASLAVIAYLLECAAGLPFLAGGTSLITMTASTGYLFGFIPMVYVIGSLADCGFSNSKIGMIVSLFLGNIIVYLFGSLWMGVLIGFKQPILQMAVLPFIGVDTLKALIAVVLSKVFYNASHK